MLCLDHRVIYEQVNNNGNLQYSELTKTRKCGISKTLQLIVTQNAEIENHVLF